MRSRNPLTALCVCAVATLASAAEGDWPSYNPTLTSERFAPQDQITRANVRHVQRARAENPVLSLQPRRHRIPRCRAATLP